MTAPSSAIIAAANMRRYRRALRLTQEELGERLGLGKVHISSFEASVRGGRVRSFKLDEVDAIAAALGVTAVDLITAPERCSCCDDKPPAGMTCQVCGTDGPDFGGAA